MAEIRQQPVDLEPEQNDTHREWQAAQKIPLIRGFFVEQGGGQIDFEDEDPQIDRDFEAAIVKVGARCSMGSYHQRCIHR